jgi:hypothetical protein
MEVVLDVDAGVHIAQPVPEKRSFLKYTPAMEILLVKTVLVMNAHKSSTTGTFEVKFTAVVESLWLSEIFSCKGAKPDWSTIRNKFLTLVNNFKKKIGLGTDAMVNCSALPDIDMLSEMESLLLDICRDEELANAETALQKEAADEKMAVKDGVCDVITSGSGRKGLPKMAKDLLATKPDSKRYQKFSGGFGNPVSASSSSSSTPSSSSSTPGTQKKRQKRDADNVDNDEVMDFLKVFAGEAVKDEEREAAVLRQIEASNEMNRAAIHEMQASNAASSARLAQSLDSIGETLLKFGKK